MLKWIERILNSNWVFGLTRVGGLRRRLLIIGVGACLWAWLAAEVMPPPWDAATGQRFLFYPFRALFSFPVFPLILLLSIFFALLLFLAPRYLPQVSPRLFRYFSRAVAAGLGAGWAFLAYQLNRVNFGDEFAGQLLSYPFDALFAAPVLRHVLVAVFIFWFAFRTAALYLTDIFELENSLIAEQFILQAAFASGYNRIRIKEGAPAPEDLKSPVIQIGGPGLVRVHLENAAIFEAFDGTPRVIGPTRGRPGGVEPVGTFERLRAVIDLRDQIEELSVSGRTSDGIRVTAEDVRVVFSVDRGEQPSSLEQPYPFEPQALLKLFYGQQRESVALAINGLVRRELIRFISQHSLNEFLASTDLSDVADLTGSGNGGSPAQDRAFVTRPQMITDLFASQFRRQAKERGVELKWIGVGTWKTPEDIVPRRHLEAWRLTLENLVRGSEPELERVQRENEALEFLRLVREVPVQNFRDSASLPAVERMRRIIIAYHGRLNEVYQSPELLERFTEIEQAELQSVLLYLARFTTRRAQGLAREDTPPSTEPAGDGQDG